jgi:tRNA(Ile2) C34 agmatinyltransferase TiaS
MERQSYAITSRRYQEVFEKKKLAKRRAEGKKARKRKRVEAKEKDKLVPAVTTVKRKLFTKTGVDTSCSSCHKTITSESGRGLRCDDCSNVFYEKCIPKYHKEHIPISEDGDEFLCHMCYKVWYV